MKFSKLSLKYVVVIMASVALFSCVKGEDGPTGPMGDRGEIGPAGENGADGADGADGLNGGADGSDGANGVDGQDGADGQDGQDGADGADGEDGEDGQDGATGTANVAYSSLITIKAADWDVSQEGRFWFAQIDEPKLTEDIFSKGVVLVYSYSAADGGVYFLMPDGTFTNWVRVNTIGISRRQENSPFLPPTDRSFRYVLIPGGVSTTAKSAPDFKKMTFEEVMDHFGLDY